MTATRNLKFDHDYVVAAGQSVMLHGFNLQAQDDTLSLVAGQKVQFSASVVHGAEYCLGSMKFTSGVVGRQIVLARADVEAALWRFEDDKNGGDAKGVTVLV